MRSVAPYKIHLVSIQENAKTDEVYERLLAENIEVLYDDREVGAGEKLNDADLIGIPVRLVVSSKLEDKVEFKKRNEEKIEILDLKKTIDRLK